MVNHSQKYASVPLVPWKVRSVSPRVAVRAPMLSDALSATSDPDAAEPTPLLTVPCMNKIIRASNF